MGNHDDFPTALSGGCRVSKARYAVCEGLADPLVRDPILIYGSIVKGVDKGPRDACCVLKPDVAFVEDDWSAAQPVDEQHRSRSAWLTASELSLSTRTTKCHQTDDYPSN